MATICLLFTLGALLVSQRTEKLPVLLQKLHLLLGGYFLPPIGNALVLPLTDVLLSTFVCAPDLESRGEFVLVDSSDIECYTMQHVTLMIVTGIALVLYYPIALRNLPVRVGMDVSLFIDWVKSGLAIHAA